MRLRDRIRSAWRAMLGRTGHRMAYIVVSDLFDVAPAIYFDPVATARHLSKHRDYMRGLPVGAADIAELEAWDFMDAGEDRVWAIPVAAFDSTDTVRYNVPCMKAAHQLPKKEATHAVPNRVMAVSRWGETGPAVDPGAIRDALAIAGYGLPTAGQAPATNRGALHDELDLPWGDVPFAPDGSQASQVRQKGGRWEPGDEDIPF